MSAKHLREWLQEHQVQESAAEVEDEGVMSELGGGKKGIKDRREGGYEERKQPKWEMVVELI